MASSPACYTLDPAQFQQFVPSAPSVNPYDLPLDGYSVGELDDLEARIVEELIVRARPFVAGERITVYDDPSKRRFIVVVPHPDFVIISDTPQVFYRECGPENVIYSNQAQNLRRA